MNIVVHYPKDKRAVGNLKEQIAVLHGEYIYSYLSRLNIPEEEKMKIVQGILETAGKK